MHASPEDELFEIAARLGRGADPARLQALLAGSLCAGPGLSRTGAAALAALIGLEPPDAQESLEEVDGIQRLVELSLRDPDFGFAPLLPEDECPLAERAGALAAWCDDFVEAFSVALAEGGREALSGETEELLGDLGAIAAGLDPGALADGGDDDERDFLQIAEFVRIAAISIFAERSRPPGALH